MKTKQKSQNNNNTKNYKRVNNKKDSWETIWPDKLKRKDWSKFKKRKSIPNRLKSGKKILEISLKIKKIKLNTWKMFINNIRKSWRNKWKTSKTNKTERKWTLCSYFITKLWWRQQPIKINTWKRIKFETKIREWFVLNIFWIKLS